MVSFGILLVARTARIAWRTDRQTDRQNDKPSTVTLAAHARRGLIIRRILHSSTISVGLAPIKFDGLLALVKEYIVDVWEIRKNKLYDNDSGSGLQLHTQSSSVGRGVVSSARMVSLARMVYNKLLCLVRKVKCI